MIIQGLALGSFLKTNLLPNAGTVLGVPTWPEFKRILEENFSSSSMHHLEDTKDHRSLWWTQRNSLDQHLSKFLSNLEDLWFGPWKFLLLGEFSGCKQQEAVQWKLVYNLKVKCKVDAHEGH